MGRGGGGGEVEAVCLETLTVRGAGCRQAGHRLKDFISVKMVRIFRAIASHMSFQQVLYGHILLVPSSLTD